MAESVRVVAVVDETPDARSLVLELPEGWSYRPGQFLTVLAGQVARSYSLCSSPHLGEQPKITVKRVAYGIGSNWICDNVVPGSTLDMLPPGGVFTPGSFDGDFLLLAGGSGITPVISILKSALSEGSGRVVLFYANRDEQSIIFAAELESLVAAHPERLTVIHWLDCHQGPPTVAALREAVSPFSGYQAFLCGPDPFMAAVVEVLGGSVTKETFESLVDNPFDAPVSSPDGRVVTLEVTIDNQTRRLDWPEKARLLDVLLANGINAPYSCRQANCGACACRLLSGEVKMVNNEILEEEDFAEGYILACQAHPVTDEVTVTYY